VRVAQGFDAVGEDGQPFFSPGVLRLIEPEPRSRVVGYLSTAAVARPGVRTDGAWVWPESLAVHVRERGVGPPADFVEYMSDRDYVAPAELPRDVLDHAARLASGPPAAGPRRLVETYFAGFPGPEQPVSHVIRRTRTADRDQDLSLEPAGAWVRSGLLSRDAALARVRVEEVSEHRASELIDGLVERWYRRRLRQGLESDFDRTDMLIARVFDAESPSGSPWFSPNRLRVAEPQHRERLASYLEGGRLVLRATGRAVDPLEPALGPVVPLGYRTDGTWVWQEALAYYLRARGVAPELALLCHIEERGCQLPETVADGVAARAAEVAREPMPPRPEREPMLYYASYHQGQAGQLARAPRGDAFNADSLQRDLRWRFSDVLFRQQYGGSDYDLVEIPEDAAVRIIDDRCARAFAALSSTTVDGPTT